MADRRSLTDGLKSTPTVDPAVAREFVHEGKLPGGARARAGTETQKPPPSIVGRAPLTTRIRADLAAALKRASLERQLAGVTPNTLQEILEEAVEPWLREKGYIR